MSDLEDRGGKPKRLTVRDLIQAAQSGDAGTRKQAFQAYLAWKRAAPQIPDADRLSQMECDILNKLFVAKGFSVPGYKPPPPPRQPFRPAY